MRKTRIGILRLLVAQDAHRRYEKGPLRFRPLPKEDGCRFHGYKLFGVKATVRKVINMMNFSSFSPKMWSRIIRGAVSWEQDYSSEDACHHYRVTYPNGYGASIIGSPYFDGHSSCWRVVLLKDDKLCIEDDGTFYTRWLRSEGEVYDICDIVSRA